MSKWYEIKTDQQDILVASRIRLSRNLKAYRFPSRQSKEEQEQLLKELFDCIEGLAQEQNKLFQQCDFSEFGEIHKKALEERNLIHKSAMKQSLPMGMSVSEDESNSILFLGDDHIRMQISKRGLKLEEIWEEIDAIDDYFGKQQEYAFDETLGYLTTLPTHVGTGMKAYVVLHLPFLCGSERLRGMLQEMSRYGVNVRFGFGTLEENPGNLVVLYNQKTLGVSEKEIIQLLNKVATHIQRQEERVRTYHIEHYRLEMEDRVCKSYGVLKYARMLTLEEALEHLSNLQWGISCGLVRASEALNGYQMMLEIQPANLQVIYDRPMEDLLICKARAAYIRKRLPEILLK